MNVRNMKCHAVVTDSEILSRRVAASQVVVGNLAVCHFIREGPAPLMGKVHLTQPATCSVKRRTTASWESELNPDRPAEHNHTATDRTMKTNYLIRYEDLLFSLGGGAVVIGLARRFGWPKKSTS
jgi:hypothetical protein